MEKEIGSICAEGLSFFGITNRLISHELKNILAIISETLGLIDELLELSDKGTELEPGKLQSLSESVIEEVQRANSIIRSMNTFAHSVDEFIREVDVNQILNLMIEITRLDSALKNATIRLVEKEGCAIYTSPFFLEKLIYNVMNFSLSDAGSEKEIRVSSDSDDKGVRIVFSGIFPDIIGEFPTRKEDLLAQVLSAKVSLDRSAGELSIVLPHRIEESFIQNLMPEK